MRRFRLLLVLPLLLSSAVIILWIARLQITEAAVGRWFAAKGVEARYRITALSPASVSLARLSLGNAAHPDFTAERVDAVVSWSMLRPRIAVVRLVRPDLHATLSRSGISFDSLDRLIPAAARPSRALPDIDLTIVGGSLRLGTPAGFISGKVAGRGRLVDGFSGRWHIAPAVLAASGCATALTGATIALATTRSGVAVAADGALSRARCAQGMADTIDWRIAATLPQGVDRYSARFDVLAAKVSAGPYRGQTLTFHGDARAPSLAGPTMGRVSARADEIGGPAIGARYIAAEGPFHFDTKTGVNWVAATVTLARATAAPFTAGMRAVTQQLAGTLAQPIYAALLNKSAAAARSFSATGSVVLRSGSAGFDAEITGLAVRAATGAQLRQTGRIGVSSGVATLRGGVILEGGGLPSVTLTGAGSVRGDRIAGVGMLIAEPWAVAGGAIDNLRVSARSDGRRLVLSGMTHVSGSLGAGLTAQRLGFPIELAIGPRGSRVFGQRCMAIDWAGLFRDTLALGPGIARVCPVGPAVVQIADGQMAGSATVAPLRLHGRLDATPLSVDTAALRLTFAGSAAQPVLKLARTQVTIAYGSAHATALLDGQVAIAGASGTGKLAAASLVSPDLPVTIADASGRWSFAGGRLELGAASTRIADRTTPASFEPLRVDGVSVVVANGKIDARGSGRLASTGTRLFGFTAHHDLASAHGSAAIEIRSLGFGADLQPYQITEALRGVVDNVAGPVSASGRIAWDGATLTSRGTLAIDHVSLATEALGPIDDIAGTLAFDDLLALTTPAGQELTIKRINPGVAVDDGVVHFQMLGPDAARIESIVWPYAGGTLTLAPVTVRAGDTVRSFTLAVDGLDAEPFLQKFDIKDLNVTGRFDGKLPLVFAGGKGRIVAGTLIARPGGGLLQYVGAVGGENTGAAARLAFDALRRLRYRSLTLDLDGELDGELVTQLRFAGTNEAATTLGGGPLPIRATGLPFRFNVTVRAPFRALLGTASSFSDVRPLIRPAAAGVKPQ